MFLTVSYLVLGLKDNTDTETFINFMAIFISSSFLLVFILMFAVLWVLFNGMKERRRFDSSQTDVLSKEQKTMLVIFFIFELGYLVRAVNDSFIYRKSQTQIKV